MPADASVASEDLTSNGMTSGVATRREVLLYMPIRIEGKNSVAISSLGQKEVEDKFGNKEKKYFFEMKGIGAATYADGKLTKVDEILTLQDVHNIAAEWAKQNVGKDGTAKQIIKNNKEGNVNYPFYEKNSFAFEFHADPNHPEKVGRIKKDGEHKQDYHARFKDDIHTSI